MRQQIIKRNLFPFILGAGALFTYALAQPARTDSIPPPDAEIQSILADRVDNQQQSVGMVVGIIDPKGRRVVTYGSLDQNDQRSLSGDTVFEIGGITKVFTALVLSDMAQRHEVALTDPVAKYLPKTATVPERGRQITLEDLATHVSGLPRDPAGWTPKDVTNPYADYTAAMLYKFIGSYKLQRDVGAEAAYSNLGFGLLGQALALRAGMSYGALVQSRIARPLGMKSTTIALSPELKRRLAAGHNHELKPASNWDFQALAGAGALRSTANDLLTFLAAQMGYSKSTLAPAMHAMLKVRRPTTIKGLENALGWQISTTLNGKEIVEKNGMTLSVGYGAYLGYDPDSRIGVVVLSNAATSTGVRDIGLHLLDPHSPLRGRRQKEAAVNPALFDGYTGRYQFAPTVIVNITREGNRLFAQTSGQPKFEVFPQSDRNYFYKSMDAQLSFETDGQGRATAVILYYNGNGSRAQRIEGQPAAAK